jgi:hypothetical protein
MARAQRFQRVADLHGNVPDFPKAVCDRPKIAKQKLPACGQAARDARFLGHETRLCQSKRADNGLFGCQIFRADHWSGPLTSSAIRRRQGTSRPKRPRCRARAISAALRHRRKMDWTERFLRSNLFKRAPMARNKDQDTAKARRRRTHAGGPL